MQSDEARSLGRVIVGQRYDSGTANAWPLNSCRRDATLIIALLDKLDAVEDEFAREWQGNGCFDDDRHQFGEAPREDIVGPLLDRLRDFITHEAIALGGATVGSRELHVAIRRIATGRGAAEGGDSNLIPF